MRMCTLHRGLTVSRYKTYRVRFQLSGGSLHAIEGSSPDCSGRHSLSSAAHARMRLRNSASLVVALQRRRRGNCLAVKLGKWMPQSLERAAHDAHIVRVQQVRCQGGLHRLILHVAPEIRAPRAPPRLLLGGGEEVLGDVVGAFDHGDDPAPRPTVSSLTGCPNRPSL